MTTTNDRRDVSALSEGLGPLPEPLNKGSTGFGQLWNPIFSAEQMLTYAAAAVAAERERCAEVLKARADKIAAEADRAAENEPDEVSALRAMAWQLTVAEREIRGPNA